MRFNQRFIPYLSFTILLPLRKVNVNIPRAKS